MRDKLRFNIKDPVDIGKRSMECTPIIPLQTVWLVGRKWSIDWGGV